MLLLVRHPSVARAWAGRCYGRSDMGLSREGTVQARTLAATLAAMRPVRVVHSGLTRTARLATRVAALAGVPAEADPRWQERDFGGWEGRRWDAIWRETGDLMDRMLSHPASFRPGGGETTQELIDRAHAAYRALPGAGPVVVVSHGGPIAAVRAHLAGAGVADLPALIPTCGAIVRLPLPACAEEASSPRADPL